MVRVDCNVLWYRLFKAEIFANVGHQFIGHPTLPATRVDAFLVPPRFTLFFFSQLIALILAPNHGSSISCSPPSRQRPVYVYSPGRSGHRRRQIHRTRPTRRPPTPWTRGDQTRSFEVISRGRFGQIYTEYPAPICPSQSRAVTRRCGDVGSAKRA